jgi:hypothetical protein
LTEAVAFHTPLNIKSTSPLSRFIMSAEGDEGKLPPGEEYEEIREQVRKVLRESRHH